MLIILSLLLLASHFVVVVSWACGNSPYQRRAFGPGRLFHANTKTAAGLRTDSATAHDATHRWMATTSSSSQDDKQSPSHRYAPTPIDAVSGWPHKFPAKEHCSRCGLCETTFVSHVKDACALLYPATGMRRMDELEWQVHGRSRNMTTSCMTTTTISDQQQQQHDELRFGVLHEPIRLARGVNMLGAQWTGVVTSIAVSMLESDMVDAVVCIAAAGFSGDDDGSLPSGQRELDRRQASFGWSHPEPILARTVDDVLRGRGVKPALAPSLRLLDDIQSDPTIQRLLFCGVGCAVQAFRAVQHTLTHVKQVYVLGTNCADNSPTAEAANQFVEVGLGIPTHAGVQGYEFMQDFRVHVKLMNDYVRVPYFCLPGSIAEQAIAKSCMTCFDYTNGLADVVVGYMGAPLESPPPPSSSSPWSWSIFSSPQPRMDESLQTLTIRNARGSRMVESAVSAGRLWIGPVASGFGHHEPFTIATVKSDGWIRSILQPRRPRPIAVDHALAETMTSPGMPRIVGEFMAMLMRTIGPKGINFARYSIDYHALRNYLYTVDRWGDQTADRGSHRSDAPFPAYVQNLIKHYLQEYPEMKNLLDTILELRHKDTTSKSN